MRPDSLRLQKPTFWAIAAIFIGLPFHAFVLTALTGHLTTPIVSVVRIWKDLLIAGLVVAAIVAAWQSNLRWLLREPLVWLAATFVCLHALIWLVFPSDVAPGILALKVNSEFLLFYLAAAILAGNYKYSDLSGKLTKLIVWPATLVGAFGTLQLTVLPRNILSHFGYGASTVRPYGLIEGSNILRINSFLWGPNQLGSYLVLPLAVCAWLILFRRRYNYLLPAVLMSITLFGSQSRGAWLAAASGIAILIWWRLPSLKWRLGALLASVVIAIALILSPSTRPYIFHNNTAELAAQKTSNGQHVWAITRGIDLTLKNPLGNGLEAAGRASEGLPNQLYTENFYLQVAVQIGMEGLAIFLALIILAGIKLWQGRDGSGLEVPLLAALIGLSLNNLVAHTWSDGATALLWWGSAGLLWGSQWRENDK